jgi:hypothetical protein
MDHVAKRNIATFGFGAIQIFKAIMYQMYDADNAMLLSWYQRLT